MTRIATKTSIHSSGPVFGSFFVQAREEAVEAEEALLAISTAEDAEDTAAALSGTGTESVFAGALAPDSGVTAVVLVLTFPVSCAFLKASSREVSDTFLAFTDSGESGRETGAIVPVPSFASFCSRMFPAILCADGTRMMYFREADSAWLIFTITMVLSGSLTEIPCTPTGLPETSSETEISTGSSARDSLKVSSIVRSSMKSIFWTVNHDPETRTSPESANTEEFMPDTAIANTNTEMLIADFTKKLINQKIR